VVDRAGNDGINAGIGNAGGDQLDLGWQRFGKIGSGAEGAVGEPDIAEATKNPNDQQPGEGMSANRSSRAQLHRPVG
jgi:hypothetical protein